MGLLRSNSKKDPAFLSKGFRNWKKVTKTFEDHQVSDTHRTAAVKRHASRAPSVCVVIDEGLRKRQEAARHCLLRIFSCVKYLLRQCLPFRGHHDKSGNSYQLLMLLAEDDLDLRVFLQRSTNFTSATSQHDMIKMYSYCILRKLASDKNESGMFAIMVDGSKDITGKEQESICIRHVDAMLYVHKEFMGLYGTASTTGEAFANIVSDVLIRFSLPINNLRAQLTMEQQICWDILKNAKQL